MDSLFGPKLTDKEVAEGAPVREAYRKDLLSKQSFITSGADTISATPMNKMYKALSDFTEKEIAWVNANVEVSKRAIETRQTKFNEEYSAKQTELLDAIKTNYSTLPVDIQEKLIIFLKPFAQVQAGLRGQTQEALTKKADEETAERIRKANRTTGVILKDAFTSVSSQLGRIAFTILIVTLALRCASFAVNDNLWKPLPYRILLFIYVLLFFPITIPYYIYREIRGLVSPDPDMVPQMEGFFPINPYTKDINVEPTLLQRLFGYEDTPRLATWIEKKLEQYEVLRQESLKSNVLETLKAQEQEQQNS